MKKILLTAAALTLGTSAHAWTTMHEQAHERASAVPAAFADWVDPTASDDMDAEGDGLTWSDADIKSKEMVGGVTLASADMGAAKTGATAWQSAKADTDGMVWADADIKSKDMVGGMMAAAAGADAMAGKAATASWQGSKSAGSDGLTWAEADIKSKEMVGGMAAAGTASGMGGPIEAQGYPACRPGRGDDNCIQLYERGVREQLAAYKASDDVAMGGPFEPAADAKPAAGTATAEAPAGPKVPNDGSDGSAVDHSQMDHGDADHGTASDKPAGAGTTTPSAPKGVGGK